MRYVIQENLLTPQRQRRAVGDTERNVALQTGFEAILQAYIRSEAASGKHFVEVGRIGAGGTVINGTHVHLFAKYVAKVGTERKTLKRLKAHSEVEVAHIAHSLVLYGVLTILRSGERFRGAKPIAGRGIGLESGTNRHPARYGEEHRGILKVAEHTCITGISFLQYAYPHRGTKIKDECLRIDCRVGCRVLGIDHIGTP